MQYLVVQVGLGLDEQLHHAQTASHDRLSEGRDLTGLVLAVDVCLGLQEDPGCGLVRVFGLVLYVTKIDAMLDHRSILSVTRNIFICSISFWS